MATWETPSSKWMDNRLIWLLLLMLMVWLSWLSNIFDSTTTKLQTDNDKQYYQPPNILLIVADDLGYNDISTLSTSGVHTPNIDSIAQKGVTFTRHYADSTCAPSRAALITGRYPERSSFRPVGTEIPAEFVTLPEALKEHNYATHLVGKWHIGEENPSGWPSAQGFDSWFGFLNQWQLTNPLRNNQRQYVKPTYNNPWLRENDAPPTQHSGHLTDILTNHTIKLIESSTENKQPWFIYQAYFAPHYPIQPANRFAKKFPDTPEGNYLALIDQLDNSIGRLLHSIKKNGIEENTIVIFLSDNGGTNEQRDNNFPFKGRKGETLEGSFRTPLIINWPGHLPAGQMINDIAMNTDIYPTILAAIKRKSSQDLDGISLWERMTDNTPLSSRSRTWEQYHPVYNGMSYSILSQDGRWRLSNMYGLPPKLYDLQTNPSGGINVVDDNPAIKQRLEQDYWQQHIKKAEIQLTITRKSSNETIYTGFNFMRTPLYFGFSLAMELGPLKLSPGTEKIHIADQGAVWSLDYLPYQGLVWTIGRNKLPPAAIDPSKCNKVVLTSYVQPESYLDHSNEQQLAKIIINDKLASINTNIQLDEITEVGLNAPTRIALTTNAKLQHKEPKVKFSNLVSSGSNEDYSLQADFPNKALFENLRKKDLLAIPKASRLTEDFCLKNI